MKPYRLWGLILLFMTASWLTAAGFSLSGVGTKGLSMGGAYRSVVSDWSSIFWNPAGLAAVEMNEISLTGTFISPLSSYVPHTQIPGYDGGYPMRYRVNAKSRLFVLPQIAYVMNADFLSSTKFGVALFTPFGLGASWDLYDPPIGFYERGYTPPKAFPEHDWESDISITCAYAGFARKFGPLSIGLSGGPLFGSISLRKVRLYDPVTVDTSLYSLPVQFRYFPIDTRFDGSGVSFGLNFGIKLEPLKNLTLGLSGRYYSPVKLTGDVNSAIYFPKNSVLESLADPEGKIFFQGGVAWNKAVVAAFEKLLGKKVTVPPHHDVTGAIGAAMLAREKLDEPGFVTAFKGFDLHRRRYRLETFTCEDCANQCDIHKVEVEGEEPLYYGARCEKYDIKQREPRQLPPDYVKLRQRLLFKRYVKFRKPGKSRGRVGIPLVLHFFDYYPFWRAFFEALD